MSETLLVYDVGSTYTKVAVFRLEEEKLSFLGRGQHPTTLQDVEIGASGALRDAERGGVTVQEPLRRYSSCSAAGGLRMVALGYMPRVTAKAAKEVAMTAGARVMEVVSSDEPPEFRAQVLKEINPDIILLSGGTDGGDRESVIENAGIIAAVKSAATVIVACNSQAQKEAAGILQAAGIACVRVPNILPTIHDLNVRPARAAIHEQFIRQITRAMGIENFRETLCDRTVIPTPGAVLLASELLAAGSYEEEGIGGVILIDVGGATTDIHSALPELQELGIEERGLVISNEKQFSYRTVEGNLGLRVSACGIPDAVGAMAVLRAAGIQQLPSGAGEKAENSEQKLCAYTETLEAHPEHIPANEEEAAMDRGLAACAVEVALRRHAGFYAKEADPVMGVMAGAPCGRDLRRVENVLCVGGIFGHCNGAEREGILAVFNEPGMSLLPLSHPSFYFDEDYVFYAMGVLARHHPEAVLAYMKEKIVGTNPRGETTCRGKG